MRLVDRAMKNDVNFRPPVEYHQAKRSQRPQEKVYIPVKEFPEINFFGLLVGPRGNSLKKMERDSGAKISIRGKGSVKEGKARPEAFADDAEEDLHCLVTGEDMEKVLTCVRLINRVIETVRVCVHVCERGPDFLFQAASTPEGQNDHKRNQLRELAALNGTLRDDENQVCQNCGNIGHRKYDCPEQRNFTANIICRICGSAGHMARDCAAGRSGGGPMDGGFGGPPGIGGPPNGARGPAGFDSEYASLMAELGEGGAGGGGGGGGGAPVGAIGWTGNAAAGPDVTAAGSNVPPWRRPEMWIQSAQPQPQRPSFQPPAGYNGQGWGGGQQQQGAYPQGGGGGGGQFSQQGYYPQGQQQGQQGGFDYAQYYAQYGQQQPA
jgi:splicing factor 1